MLKIITGFLGWFFGGSDQSELVEGPRFEELEGKILMSASASSLYFSDNAGTLQVLSTGASPVKVKIDVRGTLSGTVAHVMSGKTVSVFRDVKGLYVNLGDGKNNVDVSVVLPGPGFYTQIITGDQNDIIRFTGVGLEFSEKGISAYVNSNSGRDKIFISADGPTHVNAGPGDDFVTDLDDNNFFQVSHVFHGADGNDRLITYVGAQLYGGPGNNTLISRSSFGSFIEAGGFGNNTIRTAGGWNHVVIGSGNTRIIGGQGSVYVSVFPTNVWDEQTQTSYELPLGKLDFIGGRGYDYLELHPTFEFTHMKVKRVESIFIRGQGGKG